MKLQIEVDTLDKNNLVEAIELLNYKLEKFGATLPLENVDEKPVKAPRKPKRTTTKANPPVEAKETVESVKITLADLKESAKKATQRVDRTKVRETIGEFAPKLAEVNEADYGKLYKKLQEL